MTTIVRRIAIVAGVVAALLLGPLLVQISWSQTPKRKGDGGPASKAMIDGPSKLAFNSNGDLFIYEASDDLPPAIRVIAAKTKIITTLWVGCRVTWPPEPSDCVGSLTGMWAQRDNSLLVADSTKDQLRSFDLLSKKFSVVAGNGAREFGGDGGPAVAAGLVEPHCAAVDQDGDIFVCDWSNRVRRINSKTGTISTVAGSGHSGTGGDHGPALKAQFGFLSGIAVDASGDLFIADESNRIRRVDAKSNIIDTIAGTGRGGRFGFDVADGPALKADLFTPTSLMFDRNGNLLFLNDGNRICSINLLSGVLSTIVGLGRPGFDGDAGPATRAHIDAWGMALDPDGNLFLADWEHNRIRRVDAATGVISTFAGNGLPQRGPHPPIL
jgi:hypothetical protein